MTALATPTSAADIRLSCADFAFPLLSHDQSLGLIAELGFTGVDIGLFEGRSHLRPGEVLSSSGAAADLRRRCGDRGLAIADLFLIPGATAAALAANHPDPAERAASRDVFRRGLDFAIACGAEHYSILPGIPWPEEDKAASFARAVEELGWRAEVAAAAGLPLSCEAHIGSIVPSPAETLALLEAVPALGLVLDHGHFVVPGFATEEIERLHPRAVHVHARGGCRDRIQTIAEENTIDFSRLVRSLAGLGYRGWICVEYVWMQTWDCNRVDNLSETILLRDRLRAAIGEAC
jgi:sugar phosphate isomerase/epimerase